MTENKIKNRLALDRLAKSLVDDILEMTDEELLTEIKSDGQNPKEIAQSTRNIFDRAVTSCGKARLAIAKKAVLSEHRQNLSFVRSDPSIARQKLEEVLTKHPEMREKLTLAARKGKGLSDNDVLGILEDLEELGVISPIERQDDTE